MDDRFFAGVFACLMAGAAWAAPLPPGQPATGPGGAEYRHAKVGESVHGESGEKFWLFVPDEPRAKAAPVILFLHGFTVMEPEGYRGWIEHLVRRGNVVIYPKWQDSLRTNPRDFLPNTLASVRHALRVMEKEKIGDLKRFAVVGHSAGGALAMEYAAVAGEERLPLPGAAVVVQPGQGPKRGAVIIPTPAAEKLDPRMKLIITVGDADSIVGDVSARRYWREAAGVVLDRAFVEVRSDLYGEPRLRAGHLSPMAADLEMADALDWWGWWRLLDSACEAAFSGRPMQLDERMGAWSDGTPVKPLKIERPPMR